jgi:hypothetical protein
VSSVGSVTLPSPRYPPSAASRDSISSLNFPSDPPESDKVSSSALNAPRAEERWQPPTRDSLGAGLDFEDALQIPKPPFAAENPENQVKPAVALSLEVEIPKMKLPKARRNSASPLSAIREGFRALTGSPKQRSSSSPHISNKAPQVSSPLTPALQPLTRVPADASYTHGYEFPQPPTDPVTSPKPKPSLPRILTDLTPTEPLAIQPILLQPRRESAVQDTGHTLTSADIESHELTSILDFYLEETVTDAVARGVMSNDLVQFLKSPTIMGEWGPYSASSPVYEEIYNLLGSSDSERPVTVIREALRC